jgi:hypothetical protein
MADAIRIRLRGLTMIEDTLARHYQAENLPVGHPVREAIDELRRLRADSDELRAVRMALGGDVYWMDPPDGGSVTLAEQVQRANDAGREADALRAERGALRADAARYRLLAARMVHVAHPAGSGWTLDEVLVSGDRDLDEVIDALAKEAKC